MTDTASSANVGTKVPRQSSRSAPPQTGWVGWIVFAGTMMMILGVLHAIQGLVAIFNDDYYLVGKSGLTVHLDYTTWGWTHLIGGIIIVLAGMGVLAGRTWARGVGVALAGLSALVNFAFIAAYPFWSVIVIAIDIFVIFALTVHGREIEST